MEAPLQDLLLAAAECSAIDRDPGPIASNGAHSCGMPARRNSLDMCVGLHAMAYTYVNMRTGCMRQTADDPILWAFTKTRRSFHD